jgi:hypothetical protein
MESMDNSFGRERESSRRNRTGADPLDQRLDRWVTAGRQFVEGVSGSRPGGRPGLRAPDRRGPGRPRLDGLGRWVEDRLDWLLEDGDDWREPWQDKGPEAVESSQAPPSSSRRQELEAVSRRGAVASASPPLQRPVSWDGQEDWPDDDSFSLPRWQRPERRDPPAAPGPSPSPTPGARPLPRSSRRQD